MLAYLLACILVRLLPCLLAGSQPPLLSLLLRTLLFLVYFVLGTAKFLIFLGNLVHGNVMSRVSSRSDFSDFEIVGMATLTRRGPLNCVSPGSDSAPWILCLGPGRSELPASRAGAGMRGLES